MGALQAQRSRKEWFEVVEVAREGISTWGVTKWFRIKSRWLVRGRATITSSLECATWCRLLAHALLQVTEK
jgi:hypothetical protein